MVCPNCGTDNPAEARFCMACGASLASAAPEERRTVSILFADLVGFTERSDSADPEDVRRTLVPFHERAKAAIERFGGTLDKFIGDAAMGVFGAPIGHEDDPERAVRAGLDLLEASTGDHPIRVAVNTGEAVVKMGAGPQVGEAVAGDVVNTASRMQAAAPPGGLVIGEVTHAAISDRFETAEHDPFTAKGKAEPIRIWQVLGERQKAREGPSAPLVGRAAELEQLCDLVAQAGSDRRSRLVTVVADPGLGKTRLVAELRAQLGCAVTWLAGACAPYGDAGPLEPLGAMVRGLAGVAASDGSDRVVAGLGDLAARVERDPSERPWLVTRLAVLTGAGIGADESEQPVPIVEVAGALARVFRAVAADRTVVVAIEDLHWSERVLRDVLVALVDEVDAPVVVVGTARPELLDVAPDWGERPDTTSVRLAPLSDTETAALVEGLLASTIGSVEGRHPLLANVGGNPLFAVEFARMLVDRPDDDRAAVPISVQAVIGARLDSVAPAPRGRLQDAAVVGSRFWSGALAAAGEVNPAAVADDVRELGRRELILPAVTSTFPDEAEFVFGHALIREVAYARLPRLARARKHALVATWLDSMVGERRGSFADALGYHLEQAVLLAVAAGERQEADRWRRDAAEALLDAGISALGLDPVGAFARFERAYAIVPADDPLAIEALSHSALAGRRSGLIDRAEVLDRYRRVIAFHHERGDAVKEARAQANAGGQLMALARHDEARAALAQAADLLADHPEAQAERAHVYAWQAEEKMFAGNPVEAAALADRALTTGDAREPIRIMALHIRGDSRLGIGDPDGAVDLREALVRAEALGSVSDIITTHSYLADHEWQTQGPAVALDRLDDASALADRRGALSQGSWSKVSALELLFELGRWDDLLERAEPLAHEATLDESLVVAVRMWTTIIRLRRGAAVGSLDELLAAGHQVEELQVLAPVLAIAAEAAWAADEPERVAALAREFESATRGKAAIYRSEWAPAIARTAIAAGAVDIARDLVAHSQPVTMRDELFTETAAAFVRETDGAREPAVWASLEERWTIYGDPFERAHVALALGRRGDAEAADRGRKLLTSLGVPV